MYIPWLLKEKSIDDFVDKDGETRLSTLLADHKTKSQEDKLYQKEIVRILRKALVSPARQIVENAGKDGSVIIGKLLERNNPDWGYDAQEERYVDMFEAGIIDPTKVVRTALQDAASVAGLMITTEVMVAEMPEKRLNGVADMPNMSGMEGMGF